MGRFRRRLGGDEHEPRNGRGRLMNRELDAVGERKMDSIFEAGDKDESGWMEMGFDGRGRSGRGRS